MSKIFKCNSCGESVKAKAKFCGKCGSKVDTGRFCASCSTLLAADEIFCTECGIKHDGATVVSTANKQSAQPAQTAEKHDISYSAFYIYSDEENLHLNDKTFGIEMNDDWGYVGLFSDESELDMYNSDEEELLLSDKTLSIEVNDDRSYSGLPSTRWQESKNTLQEG